MGAFLLIVCLIQFISTNGLSRTTDPLSWISTPILAWSRGGCTPYCQRGWYSSPIFIPHPNDNSQNIVIGGSYSIRASHASNGSDYWNQDFSDDNKRIWAGLIYKESFVNGKNVIIAGRSSSQIKIVDSFGNIVIEHVESSVSQTQEMRSMTIGQINPLDPTHWYIISGQASYTDYNSYVYDIDSYTSPTALVLQSGWPQNDLTTVGESHGIFNDNIGLGDLDGDGVDDIIAPSDVHYICAYNYDATPILANSRYMSGGTTKTWGEIGVWVDEQYDVQGYGPCPTSTEPDPFRPNHANSPASTFLFRGELVIVVPGNVDDCSTGTYVQQYYSIWVYNVDHTRFVSVQDGIDWSWPPQWTGYPLSQDYNVIENLQPNVAIGDIDNDGYPEFIYSSYDGKIHCFSFKSTFQQNVEYNIADEPYYWPYDVTVNETESIIFSSEPAIVDLDGDKIPEIIVVTWTENRVAGVVLGEMLILSYAGTLLSTSTLTMSDNGALTAPTVGNIDTSDDLLEITFVTIQGGLVMYKIPGTDINNANIIWGTGRGNFDRNGKCSVDYDGTPPFPSAVLPPVSAPNGGSTFPTYSPVTSRPSGSPTSGTPTSTPSTKGPTQIPSDFPTSIPSFNPTNDPAQTPSDIDTTQNEDQGTTSVTETDVNTSGTINIVVLWIYIKFISIGAVLLFTC